MGGPNMFGPWGVGMVVDAWVCISACAGWGMPWRACVAACGCCCCCCCCCCGCCCCWCDMSVVALMGGKEFTWGKPWVLPGCVWSRDSTPFPSSGSVLWGLCKLRYSPLGSFRWASVLEPFRGGLVVSGVTFVALWATSQLQGWHLPS